MSPRMGHVRAGEGPAIWMAGDTHTLKATAESTGGSLALLEASIPPGCGPPPHTHGSEDEAFYMLAGTLEIVAGADEQAPPPDDDQLTRVVEIASRHGVHIQTPEKVT
jgi:quercetin dioxygenase-like cupin family protein